ncbi:la-related protein 1-like [Nilaparvata lugens]|uniref:la-related protein 1-like n=1 Tax=Nilaparvata lugens TaxID=108931 RepID=UPI00193CD42B|nr:la-related protein 1-like [Nilaparvata lugens]
MAAPMASQSSDGSQSRDSVGSYAGAVLNAKNMDSNKENINASGVTSSTDPSVVHVEVKSKTSCQTKSVKQCSNPPVEDFPQIQSANSRSVKRLPSADKVKHHVKETGVDKSDDKPKPSLCDENAKNIETTEVPEEKKRLVEAPLPKINPWTSNKNAASVITGKPAEKGASAPVPPTVATTAVAANEKRVLQPHQQGIVENGAPNAPIVVKATRDRKRINQKASDFTDTEDWPTLGTAVHAREKKMHPPTTTTTSNGPSTPAVAASSSGSSVATSGDSSEIEDNSTASATAIAVAKQNGHHAAGTKEPAPSPKDTPAAKPAKEAAALKPTAANANANSNSAAPNKIKADNHLNEADSPGKPSILEKVKKVSGKVNRR